MAMERSIVPNMVSRETVFGEYPRPYGFARQLGCMAVLSPKFEMAAIVSPTFDGERHFVATSIADRSGRTIAKLGWSTSPVWSPDSSRFTLGRPFTHLQLLQCSSNGQLIRIADRIPGDHPVWNRTSSMLATRDVKSSLHYILDCNGRQLCDPFETEEETAVVGWSPDGEKLLMHNPVTQVAMVYDSRGRQTHRRAILCEGQQQSYHVSWAHDSAHLAVPTSHGQVMVWSTQDNSSTTFNTEGRALFTSWSPNSSRVAVVTDTDVEIRDGGTFKLMAAVPAAVAMLQSTSIMGNETLLTPSWSEDGSKFAVLIGGMQPDGAFFVMVLSKEGKLLSTITLEEHPMDHELSRDFMYLLTRGRWVVKVTCLAKWSDRTSHMFSQQFRETVGAVLGVANRLDKEGNKQQLRQANPHQADLQRGLPRLPMEIWLHILDLLQAAPALPPL